MRLVLVAFASLAVAADAPPFAEVEAAWMTFWARIAADDTHGAVGQLHSSVRSGFPGLRDAAEWREVALQMAFCRVQDKPVPAGRDAVAYPVHCRHGEATAESLVIVQRDRDGAWRLRLP